MTEIYRNRQNKQKQRLGKTDTRWESPSMLPCTILTLLDRFEGLWTFEGRIDKSFQIRKKGKKKMLEEENLLSPPSKCHKKMSRKLL